MLTAALAAMVKELAVPGVTILLTTLFSRYMESRGKSGIASFITAGSSIILTVFWLLPRLDSLSSQLMTAFGMGSGVISAPSLHWATSAPGSWGHLSFDQGALHSEISGWAANAISLGKVAADIITR